MPQRQRGYATAATIVVILGILAVAAWLAYPAVVERVAHAIAVQQVQAERQQLAELSKRDTVAPLFRAVAKTVKPAVVEVRVTKRMEIGPMPDMDEFFRRFMPDGAPFERRAIPNAPQPQREFLSRGLGSGVIVDAQNGYILTNQHVVDSADSVEIVLADGRKLENEWVRGDPATDLAVIKVKPERLIDAPLGDSDKMDVGDWVLAIGSPEGLPQTVTSGIISAKGRTRAELRASHLYQDFLQTDAAINHGNSGGPLVNMEGEVIGINTAIVSRTGVNEGIGLAIPSNMCKSIMRQLIDTGKVVRGYLGVRFQDVNERLAKSFKLPSTDGALVAQVAPGGPAEKAGLQAGDFITGINDKPVTDGNDLRNIVAELPLDKPAKVELWRDGKKQTLDVTIVQQPADMVASFGESGPGEKNAPAGATKRFGMRVDTLDAAAAKQLGYKPGAKGVVVTEIAPDSDAAEQGMAPGLVVTEVDGQAVETAEAFYGALDGKDSVRLKVLAPRGGVQYIVVSAKGPTSKPQGD